MMDRHFMEDENELPYMVRQVRDEEDYRPYDYSDNEEKLDRILNPIYMSSSQRKILKDNIISLYDVICLFSLILKKF